jgi:hypothetical protein
MSDVEYGTAEHPNAPWWTSRDQALADQIIWHRQLTDLRDSLSEDAARDGTADGS